MKDENSSLGAEAVLYTSMVHEAVRRYKATVPYDTRLNTLAEAVESACFALLCGLRHGDKVYNVAAGEVVESICKPEGP